MGTPTNAELRALGWNEILKRMGQAFLSGLNNDDTAFTLPVSGATTVTGTLSPLPTGATALHSSSGNVANAQATATLTSGVGQTVWITGFQFQYGGATAAAVKTITVTGLIGGTMSVTGLVVAGAGTGVTAQTFSFPTPVPASATNTNIVVTVPAAGAGNTNTTVSAQGFII